MWRHIGKQSAQNGETLEVDNSVGKAYIYKNPVETTAI